MGVNNFCNELTRAVPFCATTRSTLPNHTPLGVSNSCDRMLLIIDPGGGRYCDVVASNYAPNYGGCGIWWCTLMITCPSVTSIYLPTSCYPITEASGYGGVH
ncbi:hypothetical protein J6590_020418 [Homalodisca vitripennis]|nr:hypothetical protein J6590_020418 [Homalodisca vitripennis]